MPFLFSQMFKTFRMVNVHVSCYTIFYSSIFLSCFFQVRQRTKEAFPVDFIKTFVDDCNAHPQDLHRARVTLICFLGYAGFLRISAVLNIRFRHLTFSPHMSQFSTDGSKTVQHRDFLHRYLTVGLYLPFECHCTFLLCF